MVKFFSGTKKKLRIEMRASKNIVHIASGVRHLFGKPRHTAPLPTQLLTNQMAKMDFGHFFRFCFCCQRLPLPAEFMDFENIKKSVGARTLAYPAVQGLRIAYQSKISNARSPRWIIYECWSDITPTEDIQSPGRKSLLYLATGI